MEFLIDYGLFFAKVLTVVVIPLVAILLAMMFAARLRHSREGHLEVKYVNEKLEGMGLALKSAILPKKAFKQTIKELKTRHKKQEKSAGKETDGHKKRVFVLNFKGDMRASAVSSLREEITTVLMAATPEDEVLVCLESAGGMVHSYGLAASQLRRVKEQKIPLTVAVDQIAASGGYMMACVADRILAAPFAIIGSIGVVGQIPNFNRLLKKHDIDFELHTAGDHKRTLTFFGENTDQDRQKFQQDLEETHQLFKNFVREHRAQADLAQVATGEYWYGTRALELNLVDEIRTSDDYLHEASETSNIYEITYVHKKSPAERLVASAKKAFSGE